MNVDGEIFKDCNGNKFLRDRLVGLGWHIFPRLRIVKFLFLIKKIVLVGKLIIGLIDCVNFWELGDMGNFFQVWFRLENFSWSFPSGKKFQCWIGSEHLFRIGSSGKNVLGFGWQIFPVLGRVQMFPGFFEWAIQCWFDKIFHFQWFGKIFLERCFRVGRFIMDCIDWVSFVYGRLKWSSGQIFPECKGWKLVD